MKYELNIKSFTVNNKKPGNLHEEIMAMAMARNESSGSSTNTSLTDHSNDDKLSVLSGNTEQDALNKKRKNRDKLVQEYRISVS